MKKTKMTLGMIAAAMTCSLLAGCDYAKYSPEGYILTYTNAAGEVQHYSAEDLFNGYYEDSSKVSSMFDSIYKLIIRNYFTKEELGKSKYNEILKNAKNDVEGVKTKATENADTNDSDWDDEFDALLESYSCDDEEELLQHFIYERELVEFNDQFYDNNIAFLRDHVPGTDVPGGSEYDTAYSGYINEKAPYHVRHILVKVSDSGSTNYWNSTIDESDAIQLHDVVTALAAGSNTFGKIAQLYSDDGSKDKFGDLGIMDKDTSFVNEFKLGIYAYENLFNAKTTAAAAGSAIGMSEEIQNNYKAAAGSAIGEIPFDAFEEVYGVRDTVKDSLNRDVNDGNANYYPRNIYFNNYINKHQVSVIRPTNLDGSVNSTYAAMAGFNDGTAKGAEDGLGVCLRTSEGQPILVVRSGTSDYQGIHFIVLERTPLVGTVNDVTLGEYYTTKYPGQAGYPQTEAGENKQTYVNFLNLEVKDLKSRAEEVEKQIKNFDSNLNKFIYHKYVAAEKITFKDENLKNAIEKWISSSEVKSDYDNRIAWEKTWQGYIDALNVQNEERTKLISTGCAIGFLTHTGADWEEGGACYDNKIR